ncbi:MAG: serine acetyltransferase [Chthoniobacterales bacterium]
MRDEFQKVLEAIQDSYKQLPALNNTGCLNLPSKDAVRALCDELLQILFPGFYEDHTLSDQPLEEITKQRLETFEALLRGQVCKSLRTVEPRCPEAQAEKAVIKFLKALPVVRKLLATDVEAAFEGDPAARSSQEIILAYPFLETIAIQRSAYLLYQDNVPLLPRMMTEWAHTRTGIDIHPGAQIGSHFFIDHGTGVVIGETCIIGSHVKLYHGVTLGARSFQKDEEGHIIKGVKRHPNVEDYVTIYPNSTILGGETTIGAHSTIGGNVFLLHSVQADSLVYYDYEEAQLRIIPKKKRRNTSTAEAAQYEI